LACREDERARRIAQIPDSYNPWLHLTLTVGSGLAVLGVALWFLEDVAWTELLVVPVMFVISNVGEWRAHRDLLHRRIWPVTFLYDQHTPSHHVVYQHDSMGLRSRKELKLILIPPFGVALITVGVAPFAVAAGQLLTPNSGWLVLVTAALYVVTYELTHLSYHWPEDTRLGRNPVIAWLREHHRRHHDPRLMQKWNFNVTVPLWDVVRGTRIRDDQLDERDRERAAVTEGR
jgi:hypothetical protein